MLYTSTRDSTITSSFENAICSGYAPDGGLFVPSTLPILPSSELFDILDEWSSYSYPELAFHVLRRFISTTEIPNEDLKCVCEESYGFDGDVVKVVPLRGDAVFVAELFHGPTFCFKDLGMRVVIHILSYFSNLHNQRTTLLVSTTGDTGPAAVRAVSDLSNPLLKVLVHYPKDQISSFQRKQLTTIASSNVKVVEFQGGGGDDMDRPIKNILTQQQQQQQQQQPTKTNKSDNDQKELICGVNSYNIGRPLAQMVHFIWTYLRIVERLGIQPGDPNFKLDIVIPTGAMGNIAGAYMAKQMGIPLGLLNAGVNINDITYRAITYGQFHKDDKSMKKTLSDAINIQIPYNFERLLFYLTGANQHSMIKQWMGCMDKTQRLDLDDKWQTKLRQDFQSARVTDDEMCFMMKRIYEEYEYYVDPHTSVALAAAYQLGYPIFLPHSKDNDDDAADADDADTGTTNNKSKKNVVAIMATASPCKFEESVSIGLGKDLWMEYINHSSLYPKDAKYIMEHEEIEPILYPWPEDDNGILLSLEEVQMDWEQRARDLIETMKQE